MALEIKLSQKLSQSLVMTPQLQQAIKLLQLGRLEYLEVLEKELLENPVLEVAPDAFDGGGFDGGGFEAQPERQSSSEQNNSESNNSQPETEIKFLDSDGFDPSELGLGYSGTGSTGSKRTSFDDEERPSLEATLSSPEGLSSHLLWQLRTSDLQLNDLVIAEHIIGNLDRNGYLTCSTEEISQAGPFLLDEVERVLSKIQSLDPPGIAARDLRECLLIQLDNMGLRESLTGRIVDQHLAHLENRRYDAVARAEGIPVEEVFEAIKIIQRLEPRPGRPFIDDAPIYIVPDVYVRKVGDNYVITLNENGIPRLRLSQQYLEMLSASKGKNQPDKDYLQDRIRSASWLIKSVHQRQQTIFKVTESIMRFQRDFLEHGVSALHPLVLRDIAADVSMHESTISRVTTNKYVHTPQGVYELKFFFSSGLKSGAGEVSSESVKDRIRDMVAKENPKKPLSDQAIVAALRAEGIDIARRTVAKYREMMNVLSSSRRKKVF
jgi:RNA polymerase sigma-54 factor